MAHKILATGFPLENHYPNGLAASTFIPLTEKTYLPEEGRDSDYCGAFPPRLPRGCAAIFFDFLKLFKS